MLPKDLSIENGACPNPAAQAIGPRNGRANLPTEYRLPVRESHLDNPPENEGLKFVLPGSYVCARFHGTFVPVAHGLYGRSEYGPDDLRTIDKRMCQPVSLPVEQFAKIAARQQPLRRLIRCGLGGLGECSD